MNKDKSAALRALVEEGAYPTLSSAFDAAVDNLLELEREKKAWWDELARRCDEAEAHPERLLNPEEFMRGLQSRIDAYKASRRA